MREYRGEHCVWEGVRGEVLTGAAVTAGAEEEALAAPFVPEGERARAMYPKTESPPHSSIG